jgi:GGDEF domain-containing protein
VSDSPDWKQKYRALLLQMEDEEKRRRHPLTRLANRKSFDERFAEEIQGRGASDATGAAFDRAGDRVLQAVASCFVAGLRGEDFVARIGGEEFVLLMTEIPSRADAPPFGSRPVVNTYLTYFP